MKVAALIQQLRVASQQALEKEHVPDGVCHRFDKAESGTRVEKTKQRHVVTLNLEQFQAVEVVRTTGEKETSRIDSPLCDLVPKGNTYGYDLIAHVGCETFLRGRKLEEVARDLPRTIPFSSLFDLQHKFLFYFGHVHRQAAPEMTDYFRQRGGSTWLMDGTIEPDTPMFFGVHDAESRWLLKSWKIATENADAIAACLKEATTLFGRPDRMLHDLSNAMTAACEATWDDVPHGVCHFHLLRDIGEDLYAQPQAALSGRVRQIKLHPRLKEQRKGQTAWLREHVEEPLVLAATLRGEIFNVSPEEGTLGREVLLAFHQWILDYAGDGRRQGFPFDPYLLYFHRRVVRAANAIGKLLSDPQVHQLAPRVIINFEKLLRDYLSDQQVIDAARQYEEAFCVFGKLRTVLGLVGGGEQPLRDRYLLEQAEMENVRQSLSTLREEFRQQAEGTDAESSRPYVIVVEHLDRYWDHLFVPGGANRDRTTNSLEAHWGAGKRNCRVRHGREKLTLDFRSLPAEFMLVPNLENSAYVELVLGDLENLPQKMALAGRTAGSWTQWRRLHHPLNTGRLPSRLLRKENLIENLITLYDDQCQKKAVA